MHERASGYLRGMNLDESTTADAGGEPEPEDQDPGVGSGDGGSLGTPSGLPEEAPPSADQEANEAVSGGGMVNPSTEGEPKDTVEKDDDRPSGGS